MHNRLLSFINKHNLHFSTNYILSFVGKRGVDTALIILIDIKIMSAINKDEIVLGVFFRP